MGLNPPCLSIRTNGVPSGRTSRGILWARLISLFGTDSMIPSESRSPGDPSPDSRANLGDGCYRVAGAHLHA
jgi:hypothetical protein